VIKLNFHSVCLVVFLLLASFFASACDNKEKKMILSEGKIEDVLFDYHITDAIVHSTGVPSDEYDAYFNAVLKKHGITKAEFDSTMVYYMKHADKLSDIYKHLSDRMSNEARLQGVDGNSLFAGNVITGDTANVWNAEKAKVFSDKAIENIVKFHLTADSTYKKGDRLTLTFMTDFLYQDGMRNGYAAMSVRLANDSVITRTVSMSSSMQYKLEVSDDQRLGIKDIRGFIMQRKSNVKTDRNNSTLRMMVVSDIKLIRMHVPEPEKTTADADSAKSVNDNKTINNENQNNPSLRLGNDSVRRENISMHKLHSGQ
jgi:hypothetical protein